MFDNQQNKQVDNSFSFKGNLQEFRATSLKVIPYPNSTHHTSDLRSKPTHKSLMCAVQLINTITYTKYSKYILNEVDETLFNNH